LGVHGDYCAAGYQEVHFFLCGGGWRCEEKKEKCKDTTDEHS